MKIRMIDVLGITIIKSSQSYQPIVTSDDAIRIEHWDELKDEHPAQHLRPRVLLIQDEVQEAVEHETGGRLPRVHPAADEKHLHTDLQTQNVTSPCEESNTTWQRGCRKIINSEVLGCGQM